MKNNKGFSFVEVLIALVILGISTYGVSQILLQSKTSVEKSKALTDSISGVASGITHLRNVVVGTNVVDDGDNVYRTTEFGICSMLQEPRSRQIIQEIKLVAANGNPHWSSIPDDIYEPHIEGDDCPSHSSESAKWSRCYKIVKDATGAEKTQESTVKFEIRAVSLAPGDIVFVDGEKNVIQNFLEDVNPNDLTTPQDAKSLGFRLIARVSTVSDKVKETEEVDGEIVETLKDKKTTVESFAFVSALDAAPCRFPGGRSKLIEMAATGPGSLDGDRIYNRPELETEAEANPLAVEFMKFNAQAGQTDPGTGAISTNPTENVEASCAETQFRCKNDTGTRNFGGQPNFLNARIDYTSPNSLTKSRQIEVQPLLKGDRSGANVLYGNTLSPEDESNPTGLANIVFILDNRQTYSYIGDPSGDQPPGYYRVENPNAEPEDHIHVPMRLSRSHNLQVFFVGENTAETTNQFCQNICGENPAAPGVEPSLELSYVSYDGSFEKLTGSTVSCTTCYMKNCSRLGLDTFGPFFKSDDRQMPEEALDSTIPECSLNSATQVADFTPEAFRGIASFSSNPDQCIAAKVNGDELTLEARSCTDSLPVMCYNFGRYFLAENRFTSSTPVLDTVTFEEAQARCQATGRHVAPVDDFSSLFRQFGVLAAHANELGALTRSNPSTYDFVDYGKQGIFLAPQSNSQELMATGHLKGAQAVYSSIINGSQPFWINLKTDSVGEIYAPAPEAQRYNEEGFVHYFTTDVTPKLLQFRAMTNADGLASSNGRAVLMNHPKVRGVIPVVDQIVPGSKKLSFICRAEDFPHAVFKSADTSNKFSDGENICQNENGVFAPPTTSIGWVQAMSLAKEHSPDLSFPEPTTTDDDGDEIAVEPNLEDYGVWVALQQNGSSWEKPSFTSPTPNPVGPGSKKVCLSSDNTGSDHKRLELVDADDSCNFVPQADLAGSMIYAPQWQSLIKKGEADSVVFVNATSSQMESTTDTSTDSNNTTNDTTQTTN